MVDIKFPTTSVVGTKAQEGGGQLFNALCEQLGVGDDAFIVRKRAPGLRQVAVSSHTSCRGLRAVQGGMFAIFEHKATYVTPASGGFYSIANLGALPGTNPVTIAHNMKSPVPQVVCVAENTAYLLTSSGAPTTYPDADVGSPNSVCFLDGYFIFGYGDAKMQATGLNTIDINPLDFAYANSRPDDLLRVIPYRQELFAFGSSSIEVWQNTGQPTGFPLTRSTVIPRGLLGQWAVAGWEEGWANQLAWAADDGSVYTLSGYAPTRISTHDVERSIETVTDRTKLRALVYMSEGHAIWQLKGPDFAWAYDFTTGLWHQRTSYGLPTTRMEQSAFFNGEWLAGEDSGGTLYAVDPKWYQEGDQPLVWKVISSPMNEFPFRSMYARADFDFVQGYAPGAGADPIQVDPTIRISWSDDGGATFSMPLSRKLGRQGKYQQRVTVLRTGQANVQGRMWCLSCSDPVYVSLMGGAAAVEGRAE